MTAVEVVFRPHWVNGSWLRAFTIPYVCVQGVETRCAWREPVSLDLPPGHHRVLAYVRYKAVIPGRGGMGERDLTIPDSDRARIVVSNGPINSDPFIPRLE